MALSFQGTKSGGKIEEGSIELFRENAIMAILDTTVHQGHISHALIVLNLD